jgi:hypothetical protein
VEYGELLCDSAEFLQAMDELANLVNGQPVPNSQEFFDHDAYQAPVPVQATEGQVNGEHIQAAQQAEEDPARVVSPHEVFPFNHFQQPAYNQYLNNALTNPAPLSLHSNHSSHSHHSHHSHHPTGVNSNSHVNVHSTHNSNTHSAATSEYSFSTTDMDTDAAQSDALEELGEMGLEDNEMLGVDGRRGVRLASVASGISEGSGVSYTGSKAADNKRANKKVTSKPFMTEEEIRLDKLERKWSLPLG